MGKLSAIIGDRKGVSILAAIFIIVILGFMGTMFVSMIGSGSLTSVNNLQTTQALYVAEGGLEFALRDGTFPNYTYPATALGSGSFTTTSQYIGPGGIAPATITDNPLSAVATIVNATSTANYVIPGAVQIDSETIYCTGAGAVQFTGCTRGWAGSTAIVHNLGAQVRQCTVTAVGTIGAARRTVRMEVGTGGASGNLVVNGGFAANLASWPQTVSSADGVSLWSNLPTTGGSPGSLLARTSNCAGAACRGLRFAAHRSQVIAIPAGSDITLQLRYCKNAVGDTAGGSRMDTSVTFIRSVGGNYTAWSDGTQPGGVNCANDANWTQVNVTFNTGSDITEVRIEYDLRNRGGGGGDDTQKFAWFDEVRVVASGGGASVLSWQEVVN